MDEIEFEIKKTLPSLDKEVIKSVIAHLGELGVSDKSHLFLIEEADLLPVLKTIQARLLIRSWKNNDTGLSPVVSRSEQSNDAPGEPSTSNSLDVPSTSTKIKSNLDWAYEFEIPWGEMPRDLIKSFQEKKRPTPKSRREMIRVVAAAVKKISEKPGRRALDIISRKMVKEYPSSLTDLLCGQMIGEGHSSILKSLEVRFDNMNRSNPFNVIKRTLKEKDSNLSKKKLRVADCYGCINWQPADLPVNETEATQNSKKDAMKEMALCNPKTLETHCVLKLLKETYFTLRKDINSGSNIICLKQEWPLLFSKDGIFHHFEMLTGIDIEEKISESLSVKGLRIFSFLKAVSNKSEQGKRIQTFLNGLDLSETEDPQLATLISLLALYLDEDIKQLFITVEVTMTQDEIENLELSNTPCVICYGENMSRAAAYSLCIDGKVVINNIRNFSEAFAIMFGSYYVFNIHYAKSAVTTLEFIQRCILGINPNRGSKADPKKRKKEAINSKLLNMINKISDFEWNTD